MNFNVVDGTDEILPREKLSAFEADYLNSELKSVEVRMKYGLSKRQYSEITREIRERYGLIRRPYAQSKHFYQWGNGGITSKRFGKRSRGIRCKNYYRDKRRMHIGHSHR